MARPISDDVNRVLSEIRAIDESFVKNGVSSHFLEFVRIGKNELVINGNSEGLVHLACRILELAATGVKGAHQHFDESEIIDQCDMRLTVSLKDAEWD